MSKRMSSITPSPRCEKKSRVEIPSDLRQLVHIPLPPPQVWLDNFPNEVCQQIAKYVSGGRRTESAYSLAMVSDTQKEAVMLSLDNVFEPLGSSNLVEYLDKWTKLPFTHIQTLNLENVVYNRQLKPYFRSLIGIQTLKTLHLPSSLMSRHLKALTFPSSLQKLHIPFCSETLPPSLINQLKNLNLKSLVLQCRCYRRDNMSRYGQSVYNCSRDVVEPSKEIARNCPNLNHLDIICGVQGLKNPLWAMLPLLPELKSIVMYGLPPSSVVDKLKNLKISWKSLSSSLQHLPESILPSIHSIDLLNFFDHSQNPFLQNMHHLRDVTFRIHADIQPITELDIIAESNAFQTIRKLKSLRRLHLIYIRMKMYDWPTLHILEFLDAAKNLEELKLTVPRLNEIRSDAIARRMGKKLICLEFVELEKQTAFIVTKTVWLENLMRSLSLHNPNIQKLVCKSRVFGILATNQTCHFFSELRSRLQQSLGLIQRRNPVIRMDPDVETVWPHEHTGICCKGIL